MTLICTTKVSQPGTEMYVSIESKGEMSAYVTTLHNMIFTYNISNVTVTYG